MSGASMPDFVEYDGWVVHSRGDRDSLSVGVDVYGDDDGGGGDGGSVGSDVKWVKYKVSTSSSNFASTISSTFGTAASEAFQAFKSYVLDPNGGLYASSCAVPPFALRSDKWSALTLKSYYKSILKIGPSTGKALNGPFVDYFNGFLSSPSSSGLTNSGLSWVKSYYDYLSFALSGYSMSRTQAAPVAYMTGDLFNDGACLNFPKKGGALKGVVDGMVDRIRSSGM